MVRDILEIHIVHTRQQFSSTKAHFCLFPPNFTLHILTPFESIFRILGLDLILKEMILASHPQIDTFIAFFFQIEIFYCSNYIEGEEIKSRQAPNMSINKKSTIFVLCL